MDEKFFCFTHKFYFDKIYLKNKYFVLFMANICTRNEVSSIFAIKPAQDSSIQLYLSTARTKLARKRRNLRSCGRASFLYLESCAGFIAQIDETSLREHIFAVNKTKSLFLR